MNRREDFKRFIVFCLAGLVVIAQTAVFAYIWYDYYRGLIFEPFWRKGNWVLIAIYGLINVLFSRLYGGALSGDSGQSGDDRMSPFVFGGFLEWVSNDKD